MNFCDLTGKNAIIFGGAGGLGKLIARDLRGPYIEIAVKKALESQDSQKK